MRKIISPHRLQVLFTVGGFGTSPCAQRRNRGTLPANLMNHPLIGNPGALAPESLAVPGDPRRWLAWLLPIFVVSCWFQAIGHLSSDWTLNEQYHYGWLVPLLALYLVKVRFEQCPAPSPAPAKGRVGSIFILRKSRSCSGNRIALIWGRPSSSQAYTVLNRSRSAASST